MAEAAPVAAPSPAPAPVAAAPDPASAAPIPAGIPEPAPAPSEPPRATWPDDWRSRMAGADEKELKEIGRYATPDAIWKKARSLERRLSSGELKASLPKDAKPDELASWRKDNGIPEKADGYDLKGLKIEKDQLPIVNELLAKVHGENYSPTQARAAVEFYLQRQQANVAAVQQRDEKQRLECLDQLNVDFGSEFRRNINLVGNVLAKFPEAIRSQFQSARLPDGTALFNNPDIVKAFVALELMNNPVGVVAPADGGDIGKSALDEYKTIQKTMRENRKAYDKDHNMQNRFTSLIEYLQKNELIDDAGNEITQKRKAA